MNRDGNQKIRAMRLMEALSGADEELLERSGQEGKTAGYRRPLWHRTRALAAALCLALVGAVSWGGYQLVNMRMGSASGGKGAQEAVPQDAREAAEEQIMMDLDEGAGDGMAAGGIADQTNEMPEGMEKEEAGLGDSGETDGMRQESALEENRSMDADTPDMESCPLNPAMELTEAQARADADLGSYIPASIPEGYAFESASCMPEKAEANLSICWTRGMDSIFLHLEKPAELPETVAVDRKEMYDEHLYEVPYAETVPEEYRESFDNPVFAEEDLSLEVIQSRMKSYDDAGDTDTPRGDFSVLYQDGVLARFTGRGTAEEIWEMFCSMGKGH